MACFKQLDNLHPTNTGLDRMPSWFLRLGSPYFCKPLTRLFNLSISTSEVPDQWKQAYICPVPKVPAPKKHADFRPISITSVLTRVLERIITTDYIYPSFCQKFSDLIFSDQYAFRPSGSTTAAIVSILQTVTLLLESNPFVCVMALDFRNAFDCVRHYTLLQKMSQLNIPDCIYNWLVNYFSGHSHCTKCNGAISGFLNISASIIQGSALGPASYVINAADLTVTVPGNYMIRTSLL